MPQVKWSIPLGTISALKGLKRRTGLGAAVLVTMAVTQPVAYKVLYDAYFVPESGPPLVLPPVEQSDDLEKQLESLDDV